jgi:dethiobiotin synthetase
VRFRSSAFRAPRSAFDRLVFVTGTDTGVGKTVVAALLTHHLRQAGLRVAALKPICSGGRGDARALRAAGGGALTLDEVNPWHFRAALAPLLAARGEGRPVRLAQVAAHVRRVQKRFDYLLVEGAGGLLSPLGEGFSSRELLTTLRATPVVVCPNRLGALNQVLLVLAALAPALARRAIVVLTAPRRANLVSRANLDLLAAHVPAERVVELPRLPPGARLESALSRPAVRRALDALARVSARVVSLLPRGRR